MKQLLIVITLIVAPPRPPWPKVSPNPFESTAGR